MTILLMAVLAGEASCAVGECISGRGEHKEISMPDPEKEGTITLTVPANTSFALCVW